MRKFDLSFAILIKVLILLSFICWKCTESYIGLHLHNTCTEENKSSKVKHVTNDRLKFDEENKTIKLKQPDLLKIYQIILSYSLADCFEFKSY